jgi:hypothetical protein
LRFRADVDKEVEILAYRHQLTVTRQQVRNHLSDAGDSFRVHRRDRPGGPIHEYRQVA